MTALTLYTNPMSRGRIARWMLEEIGEPYEAQLLVYGTTMKAPDYLAINPMGKVPALRHHGRIVTECAAICTYLADAFPDAGMMPTDHAAFYRWMFFGAGPVEQAVTNTALGFVVPPERQRTAGYGSLEDVVATLEHRLTEAPYFAGDRFSAVDVYLGSQIGWGLRFGTLPDRPAFREYWTRIADRPAATRAQAADDALMEQKA
ncbi:glutathione S-transferase family protein [Gemmobacter lutimaris]|uniref:Glutathione S-transferase family protein n=1 Tax=Gemmobacter lutimaris TaxID=2306023 RepID=A0A398BWM4_9RHOB|nr:glutathione S-transferase family protein [Gemmobacter lutimaris]RID91703.1 glutathione S-transferase family protein [Gemmobacter lutimaris]